MLMTWSGIPETASVQVYISLYREGRTHMATGSEKDENLMKLC